MPKRFGNGLSDTKKERSKRHAKKERERRKQYPLTEKQVRS